MDSANTVDWARIEMLRRQWEPNSNEGGSAELCVLDQPGVVRVKKVRTPNDDADTGGVHYYQCGGGRRVVRKKIGGE
jgi:hypothetical protein